ncbi:MAG TPA: hypothetical protein VFR47_29395 [Anaerolineales bacterium]|nr:hypothetical protein [Anaerolineales bacterium]
MKLFFNLVLAFTLLSIPACANLNSQMSTPSPVPPQGSEILGVFQGNTPCSAQARPLPQIPSDTDCEQMIWSLVLYQDPQTKAPTTYQLNSAYGLPKPNTNDLVGGGTSIVMDGTWTTTTGTKTDPQATVYQINPDDPQRTASFLKVNEDLLHVLSSEKTLLVGNGAWSYTLNRMDNQSPNQLADPSSFPEPPTRPPMPPMPEGSSVFGVFDGRTPCHELVVEFTKVTSFPGCLKIKWRLTLYQDSATSAPSTYLYMGTSTYREGSWEIIHGMNGDSGAVIYQLNLDDGQPPVSFLSVDENHLYLMDRDMNLLIGNELFSYTLSRVDPNTQ